MEQITMDLMAAEPEAIPVVNMNKALCLPKSCESCARSFTAPFCAVSNLRSHRRISSADPNRARS